MANKSLLKTTRAFLTNEGFISENKISLFEGEKIVNDEIIVAEFLNVS